MKKRDGIVDGIHRITIHTLILKSRVLSLLQMRRRKFVSNFFKALPKLLLSIIHQKLRLESIP